MSAIRQNNPYSHVPYTTNYNPIDNDDTTSSSILSLEQGTKTSHTDSDSVGTIPSVDSFRRWRHEPYNHAVIFTTNYDELIKGRLDDFIWTPAVKPSVWLLKGRPPGQDQVTLFFGQILANPKAPKYFRKQQAEGFFAHLASHVGEKLYKLRMIVKPSKQFAIAEVVNEQAAQKFLACSERTLLAEYGGFWAAVTPDGEESLQRHSQRLVCLHGAVSLSNGPYKSLCTTALTVKLRKPRAKTVKPGTKNDDPRTTSPCLKPPAPRGGGTSPRDAPWGEGRSGGHFSL